MGPGGKRPCFAVAIFLYTEPAGMMTAYDRDPFLGTQSVTYTFPRKCTGGHDDRIFWGTQSVAYSLNLISKLLQ